MKKKQSTNIQLFSDHKKIKKTKYFNIPDSFKLFTFKQWGSGTFKFRKTDVWWFSFFRAILDKRENRHFFFRKGLSAKFLKLKSFYKFLEKNKFLEKKNYYTYLKPTYFSLYKFIPRHTNIFLIQNQKDFLKSLYYNRNESKSEVDSSSLIWKKKELPKKALFYTHELYLLFDFFTQYI